MSKATTVQIQDTLVSIGEQLGFRAEKVFGFELQTPYAPRYDVVWLLDVSSLKINHLPGIRLVQKKWLPFASFEIEGSTTSSKNQVGNVGNLLISPSYYHFMVVDNAGAGKENDTYRRGMKIVRTTQELLGTQQLFLLDASMLHELPNFTKTMITTEPVSIVNVNDERIPFRLSIVAAGATKNHAIYGNRTGSTGLNVGIQEQRKSSYILELNLDRYSEFEGDMIDIFHNGIGSSFMSAHGIYFGL